MSTSTTHSDDRRRNRKGILAIGAVGASIALIVTGGFAYFSDTLSFGGSATAGTLDISGTSTLTHTDGLSADNYVATGIDGTTVQNLNPGDVVKLDSSVTNNGNKSAWIRTVITGASVTDNAPTGDSNIGDDVYVFAGENVPTQAQLLATADPSTLTSLGYIGTLSSLTGTSPAAPAATTDNAQTVVIGGTGTAAEADGTTKAGGNEYDSTVVLYFDKAADNSVQGDAVSITATVQAIQYRNNNNGTGTGGSTGPTTAPGSWSDVVTSAFGADAS
jgi:predicted ribosomally synthesized peptide with SipW-like signal peptide